MGIRYTWFDVEGIFELPCWDTLSDRRNLYLYSLANCKLLLTGRIQVALVIKRVIKASRRPGAHWCKCIPLPLFREPIMCRVPPPFRVPPETVALEEWTECGYTGCNDAQRRFHNGPYRHVSRNGGVRTLASGV